MKKDLLTIDMFDSDIKELQIAEGAIILKAFALPFENALLNAVNEVITISPFRNMVTPGGYLMSVAMTNCGELGWVTDDKGYRYEMIDPVTQLPWPKLPSIFLNIALQATERAHFHCFLPNTCTINCYEVGSRLSLHQDKTEQNIFDPIVSISLGISATFIFGGVNRTDAKQKYILHHGDVVVWGGPSRLAYHGILPLKKHKHPLLGETRINITLRKTRKFL